MKYEEAAKLWGARKLRESGVTFVEILHVDHDVETDVGCPTCGPETEIVATVAYSTTNGITGRAYKRYEYWGLGDPLSELFEVSEP